MNVNSSTIIVQVEYCVFTVTQQAPTFHPPGCDVAVSPQVFVFLFIIISGPFAIYAARSTTHNPDHTIKLCK